MVWGEDVRALAAAAHDRWPDAQVAMWNDYVGPGVDGVRAIDQGDADLVLMRLPKSLAALDAWAGETARRFPEATVVAAGKIKHMTLSQNDVLRGHYSAFEVSRARQKARLLIAGSARRDGVASRSADLQLGATAGAAAGLRVVALAGAFAGATLDIGTRALLDTLNHQLPACADGEALDLGCGTGIIASWLARRGYQVRASDRSLAAVHSTAATAQANGLGDRVEVVWEDALAAVAPSSAQLIILNPPFHDQTAVTVDPAHRLFAAAARSLAPGGRLYTVWNSHLRYRAHLERAVGPTEQLARTSKFTVTVSTKAS